MGDRYQASGIEGQFQPGSDSKVLANKLGIIHPDDMEDLESQLLEDLYESVLGSEFPDRKLCVIDLKTWHRRWLGNVYDWAGQERSVNLSKGDFHFAVATQISRLLDEFEGECLSRYTPCNELDDKELVEAIAVTHVEFILVHPFREGNGRLSRLLADVMAVQAGRNPMDYSGWKANREGYFAAIQQGVLCNYEPMRSYVRQALSAQVR
ncbi:cell division protein Fic [Salinisphaera orenii MK-B5]|uniref:protein adenylyltransferase n=1 Tax=Salinisphaera orenii MK-B5 TaxID=856730 RepID=A0A423PVV6_9GAMM|nr:Fic family protein [Salinisphaera orenii]ROO29705.1 cell division protein Fic [Salinisphaera orenii MK-B5]